MVFFASEKFVSIPTTDIPSWIFNEPKYDQDEPMYIDAKDPARSISLRQARTIVRKLVAGLHAAGLSKGDCVCIHSFNDIYYPMLFLGIVAAGGVFTGTNPSYTQFELIHHIKKSKAKFLIAEPEILQNGLAAAKECRIPQASIWIFDVFGNPLPAAFRSWNELMEHGEKDWVRFDDEKTCKETTAARLFSSGTTGLPKAAEISHHNLISQHTLVFEQTERPYRIRRILALPQFHAASVPVAFTSVLKQGQAAAVMRRFELEGFLACFQKFNLNTAGIVPPIAIAIIMSPLTKNYSLKSVKHITIGAAPLGRESQERLKQLLPKEALVNQVWGMTETSCISSQFEYPEDDNTGSVGRILPCCDAKYFSIRYKRRTLCTGSDCNLWVFREPTANAESFDDEGFFRTGDIVYCDGKSKKWYIFDRKKELIKVRGFQVAPPELETVLLSHPLIIDAAVIGIKHPSDPGVEHPRAYVVKRPVPESKSLDESAVKKHCGERLAKYKELTGGVKFVDVIPKNASGKILKRTLREIFKAEQEDKARL